MADEKLSPEEEEQLRREAILGAVDESGDLVWGGSPRSMYQRKRDTSESVERPRPDGDQPSRKLD